MLQNANHWRFGNTMTAVCAFALLEPVYLLNSEAKTILVVLTIFQILTSKCTCHLYRELLFLRILSLMYIYTDLGFFCYLEVDNVLRFFSFSIVFECSTDGFYFIYLRYDTKEADLALLKK